jgi:hypothetical protein
MATPVTAEGDDDPDEDNEAEESAEESVEESSVDDEDVDMVQTNVSESGVDPEGFFDDVEEDAGNADASESIFDGVDEGESESDDTPDPAETKTSGLAQDINNGVARLSVVGLEDEWMAPDGSEKSKSDLEDEFREVFETARLGHYGEKVIDEYLMVDAEDIHPVWGLCGALLICAAVVVYRRPDGDQLIENTKNKLGQAELSNFMD